MKTFVVLLSLLAVAMCFDIESSFQSWRIQHHKFYSSSSEYQKRFAIFSDNAKRIDEFNAEKHSFTVGLNYFADMTNEEYRTLYLMKDLPQDVKMLSSNVVVPTYVAAVNAPESIDWRELGAVNPVKDQGQCGSCWAFGANAGMEGAWVIAGHKLASFSEQELLDCSYSIFGNHGCDGGLHNKAIEYVIKNKGIDSEESYPYIASRNKHCAFNASNVAGSIREIFQVKSDENDLKDAAAQHVVSIAIDASNWSFQMYKDGVYDEAKCSSSRLDHAVAIVGYGNLNGQDYWIVRNSWAAGWGKDGYILMKRNANNQCGVATKAYVSIA